MLAVRAPQVSDWEIFAPNEHRVLARSTELVYDDAPWISKAQNRSDIRYVHPKISAGAATRRKQSTHMRVSAVSAEA